MIFSLQAINDKIKQLDFQECKVRVLNVDSQASFDNILVAVIGEISNKSEPSRKFVQTFVLAEQPNGYYVLNDVFRYLVDEEEEFVEEVAEPTTEAPQVAEAAPVAEAQVTDEVAAAKVDEKLEQETNGTVEQPEEEVAPQVNGTPAQEEETPAPTPAAVEPEVVNNEKPATPEPSPAPEQKEVPVEKEAAPTPAIPKTWATIASSIKAGAAAPVVPAIPAAVPKAAAAVTTTTPAAAATAAPSTNSPKPAAAQNATPAPAAETRSQDASSNDGAGWQTAGADHKKTQSRAGEEQTVLGYIKNVTDKIDSAQLKQTLSRFGKLKYFDVSRPKVRLTLIPSLSFSVFIALFFVTGPLY